MSLPARASSGKRSDRRAALSVCLVLLAIYTATFSGLPDNPDAEVEFQTTRSLARHGSLALADTPEAAGIVASRFDVAPGRGEREGRFYSWFGVGQALGGLPFYFAGSALARAFPELEARHARTEARGFRRSEYFAHLLAGWRNPLLAACTALLLVLTARRLGVGRSVAWIAGLGYGLCTFAWPQARSTLSDVQATFCLFLGFHLLASLREDLLGTGRSSAPRLALCGLALGSAMLTRVAVAPMAAVLLGAALWLVLRSTRARTRDVLALSIPALACLALFCYTNYVRFGSVLETGYGVVLEQGSFFSQAPWLGISGLLTSPGRGLLWMAPGLCLLAVLPRVARTQDLRSWAWILAAVSLVTIAPIACMPGWHGAWTYGPRYLLPILPIAWLGVAFAMDAERGKSWTRPLAATLLAFGLAVQVPAALVDHMTHQELALQAARIRWPDTGSKSATAEDHDRFTRILWDWSFAAPWAHWRILFHRLAGRGEAFDAKEIFHVDPPAGSTPVPLTLSGERERGFGHLAWVDLRQRLGGPAWPGFAISGALLAAGIGLAFRSFRERR